MSDDTEPTPWPEKPDGLSEPEVTEEQYPYGPAAASLTPRLLGRKPSPPDERDYRLSDALKRLESAPPPDDSLLDKTFRQAASEGYFTTWRLWVALWRWVKTITHNAPTPAPAPPVPPDVPVEPPAPQPAVLQKDWNLTLQLDQSDTPHCVAFASSAWGNAEPTMDAFDNAYAHGFYYEIKRDVDGEPEDHVPVDQQQGTYVRSGAKGMKNRGRIAAYFFADPGDAGIAQIKEWLLNHGPIIMGTDWLSGMFRVDANGYLSVTGSLEGGHAWLIYGYDATLDEYHCDNSWGLSWGMNGRFKLKGAEFRKLYSRPGTEACAATEVELPAV
jgi:hypothetical protein